MDPRLALAAGSVLLASSLAAQTLAEFDFDSFTLSSPQPSFATVSDLQISNTWMYGGPSGDVWLCLTTDWNAVGGTVSFTVTPTGGVAIDYGTLAWDAVTGNSSLSDSVRIAAVRANGTLITTIDPLTHLVTESVDLSAVASLQAATVPVTFAIDFTGNPTGQSSYEIGALRLTGDQCTPAITGVTPGSLPQLTDDCFVVDGECLDHLVGVTWDGQTIPGGPGPFPGHYGEAFYTPVGANQIRVCPPFCEPIGDHEIRLFFANDSLATIVAITTPAAPTLLCEHAPKIDFEQCVYISSGPLPGPNALFVGLSLSNSPTVVPGILNFDIGAQFSSLVCLNAPPGECTKVRIGMIPPAFLGLTQFFQGIVWNFGSTVLPLPTTNVCASTYVN